MSWQPKTISEHIHCLARLTGAPDAFVAQVKQLFNRKGISLDDDAAPFLAALEDAFRREETIRSSTYRARRNLVKLQENFRKVGRAYVDQISQLKKIQSSLREQSGRLGGRRDLTRRGATRVTIRGDHRTYVTRPQRDSIPLVPGPEEIQ